LLQFAGCLIERHLPHFSIELKIIGHLSGNDRNTTSD
jgi:hypothetical protein